MIQIHRIITPDYENGGSLYAIEVTTDSALDYQEAMLALLELQDKQQSRYKNKKENDLWIRNIK